MKPKIGIYGRMNAGKSTLFNFLLGTHAAIVSPTAGTTADPVRKAYELLDFGAVTLIDTAGFDDDGSDISAQRVAKSMATIGEIDLALFVASAAGGLDAGERQFVDNLDVPYIVVEKPFTDAVFEQIRGVLRDMPTPKSFFGGHLSAGQRVLLVCPIDSEAPSGRLILPQVQALRAALDINAYAMVVQPSEFEQALTIFAPHLVVVDSQVFGSIAPMVPKGVELTSFSILLSELKGDMERYRAGLTAVARLKSGDKILLIEHCLHGVSCEDIARVKIPQRLQAYCGVQLRFEILSGRTPLPSDLSSYALAVQCGGCMVSARSLQSRIGSCAAAGLPITSYGLLLKFLN